MSLISLYTEKYGRVFAKQVIESYMKQQKISSVDELLNTNPTAADFAHNSQLLNIIRTHGYFILDEKEYQDILTELKEEETKRKKLNTDKLQTTQVNGHEIVTYTDEKTNEKITMDNTVSNRSIVNQMKDIQKEHKQFEQKNTDNTLNLINYMKDNIKITPSTKSSTDIKNEDINDENIELIKAIKDFENKIGHNVEVDFNNKIIYDNGMIYSIEKRGDKYQILSQTNNEENQNKGPQLVKKKSNYNRAA